MGVMQQDYPMYEKFINYYLDSGHKPQDIKVLELGNQHFQDHYLQIKYNLPRTLKEWWTQKGFDHTSIDLNGQDGALQIDLGKPLPLSFRSLFDIVTNGGTIEHVYDQHGAWKNVHECLKTGGIVISILPEKNNFSLGHCDYFYTLDFFEKLSLRMKYELHHNERLFFPGGDRGWTVATVFQKIENNTFDISKEELDSWIYKK